ncbi:hypothetical protein [Candidatus Magnetominusculus xianensis]|uniref:Uncharacterized protein n=1 Tax=Candidatus Magnetominusculus xianensis TaxID=1748249 RepID=A0ABR5SG51_9BACT|nr:hypothetical protein [Candidatus Magnetominusculus xianensis]KWT87648.1 hypothetical protein ASN18_1325 [Candidatus Magnetominusculus xianensis]MBF0405664.1 hypothetical protein [Nitrospirota bacterium]
MNLEQKAEFIEDVLDRIDICIDTYGIRQLILMESQADFIVSIFHRMYQDDFDAVKVQDMLLKAFFIKKSIDDINILWKSYCNHRRRVDNNQLREMKIEA